MKHGKKFNHLSRKAPHRKSMLGNMAGSLITNKRIITTVAKAKALRKFVEPLITKSKDNTTHSRRVVFSYLQSKTAVQELFDEVAAKIGERPGGYTRIIKLGTRSGDSAEMAMIELVDYNELLLQEDKPQKSKTRRSRRGSGKSSSNDAPKAEESKKAEKKSDEPKAEAAVEEAEVVEEKVEEKELEQPQAEASEADATEDKKEDDKKDDTEEKK